jgi:DNA-binding LytR/AlgR family response regulator
MKTEEEHISRITHLELMAILPKNFVQIKRNIIVNIMYITAFTATTVCLGDQHFFISARRRAAVAEILNTYIEQTLLFKRA